MNEIGELFNEAKRYKELIDNCTIKAGININTVPFESLNAQQLLVYLLIAQELSKKA